MAIGYWLEDREVGVRVLVGAGIFTSPYHPPSRLANGNPGVKRQEHAADHSLPTSPKVKKNVTYTSTPIHTSSWRSACLVKHMALYPRRQYSSQSSAQLYNLCYGGCGQFRYGSSNCAMWVSHSGNATNFVESFSSCAINRRPAFRFYSSSMCPCGKCCTAINYEQSYTFYCLLNLLGRCFIHWFTISLVFLLRGKNSLFKILNVVVVVLPLIEAETEEHVICTCFQKQNMFLVIFL
jgi:hypothetical protein